MFQGERSRYKVKNEVWTEVTEFRIEGEKCHLGIEGFHKFTTYQDCLRNLDDCRDYSKYKTGGMKINDRLGAFVISWILMPRGGNRAQVTTGDMFLLKALKENIQVNWPTTIFDNILKVTRLDSAKLPYCVFISKVLVYFGVNCIGESCESYNRTI